jgi:hypothetical protein
MCYVQLFLAIFLISSCIKPVPGPIPGPTPVITDAGPPDIFHGITADCTLPVVASQRVGVLDQVRTCADVSNTATCFTMLTQSAAKDTIVCVAQQLSMTLHQSMAKGTANDTMTAEATAIDNWIKAEQIGIRN